MKKDKAIPEDDDLRPEYSPEELTGGVRGKYVARFHQGTNIALLAPELRAAFPSDDAVNEALRSVLSQRKRSA